MQVFPELNTPRLKLRKIQVEDVDALVKYANNRKISDHIINIPHPYREPDAVFRISYVLQGFKNKSRYVFAVIWKPTQELIGEISLHLDDGKKQAQLGYWVAEPYWNKGIGTEAVEATLQFGFDVLQLELIYATCHAENKASEKVLLHNHMQRNRVDGNVMLYVLNGQEHGEKHGDNREIHHGTNG